MIVALLFMILGFAGLSYVMTCKLNGEDDNGPMQGKNRS
jgi:hypothetical protein